MENRSLARRIDATRARLERELDAWVSTANSDRPWLVPLSFLWHDGKLLFGIDASAVTGWNIRASGRARVALADAQDVVLIDGSATVEDLSQLADETAARYRAKHGSDLRDWATGLLVVTPTKVQAWRGEPELEGKVVMRDGVWLTA